VTGTVPLGSEVGLHSSCNSHCALGSGMQACMPTTVAFHSGVGQAYGGIFAIAMGGLVGRWEANCQDCVGGAGSWV